MRHFNKKSIQIAIAIGIGALVAQGCTVISKISSGGGMIAQGPQTKEDRKVGDFTHVQAGDAFEVEVTLGKDPSVVIDAPKDLLPHLKATVDHGVLDISSDTNYSISNNGQVKVYVTTQTLDGASISGAGKMIIKGTIKSDNFQAQTSGAAHIEFSGEVGSLQLESTGSSSADIAQMKAKTSKITASGASRVKINGTTDEANIESSGSSNVEGDFSADRADVQTSGAAHARLSVSKSLKAGASGSSSVTYSGSVTDVQKETSGVGSVEKG